MDGTNSINSSYRDVGRKYEVVSQRVDDEESRFVDEVDLHVSGRQNRRRALRTHSVVEEVLARRSELANAVLVLEVLRRDVPLEPAAAGECEQRVVGDSYKQLT